MAPKVSMLGILILCGAGSAWAGQNPAAKLAMHVVVSGEYLECEDLVPGAWEAVDFDVSREDLLAAGGYGAVALLAYDVEGITAVEFALGGWPTGRGTPELYGPNWCPKRATTIGGILGRGGAVALGQCIRPDSTGIILLGYVYFGPLQKDDLPITLEYVPSELTQPKSPFIGVADCTKGFEIDAVVEVTGCRIGGEYPVQADSLHQTGRSRR